MKNILILGIILLVSQQIESRRQKSKNFLKKLQTYPVTRPADVCDIEAREYKDAKKCGCRYYGAICASFKFCVVEIDPSKMNDQAFVGINKSNTKQEQEVKDVVLATEPIETDFTLFDLTDGTPCLTTCQSLSLHYTEEDAKGYIANPPVPASAPPKRLAKTDLQFNYNDFDSKTIFTRKNA